MKSDHRIVEGHFSSPAKPQLKSLLPAESEKAYFQMVLPRNDFIAVGGANRARRPICIQAGNCSILGAIIFFKSQLAEYFGSFFETYFWVIFKSIDLLFSMPGPETTSSTGGGT